MMSYGRDRFAAERFAARRRREDAAPKLSEEIPALASLQIQIEEGSVSGRNKYIRRILVDRAPALFLAPCGDPKCVDGEHDLTSVVMAALRAKRTSFQGTHPCEGSLGSGCTRDVRFDATAEYRS
jgi:hypothetical protein